MESEDENDEKQLENGSFSDKNPLLTSILRTSPISPSSGLLPNVENRKRRIGQTSIVSDEDNQSDE